MFKKLLPFHFLRLMTLMALIVLTAISVSACSANRQESWWNKNTKEPESVSVQTGDTLKKLAKDYHINLHALVTYNGLNENSSVYPGEKIFLPSGDWNESSKIHNKEKGSEHTLAARTKDEESHSSDGQAVLKNTVIEISSKTNGEENQQIQVQTQKPAQKKEIEVRAWTNPVDKNPVSTSPLAPLPNDLSNNKRNLKSSDKNTTHARVANHNPSTAKKHVQYSRNEKARNKKARNKKESAELQKRKIVKKRNLIKKTHKKEKKINNSHCFIWPNTGKIIHSFGKKKDGSFNDGIDIATKNKNVFASKNGEVIYIGNAIVGYHNLILIRHNNEYITAYSHNKEILVKKGETVKQGQKIATVMPLSNGVLSEHFELRKGIKSINPVALLKKECD